MFWPLSPFMLFLMRNCFCCPFFSLSWLPCREAADVDSSLFFSQFPSCPCSSPSVSPESLMPHCPYALQWPSDTVSFPPLCIFQAATGGGCESLRSQKSKAERPGSTLRGKHDVGGDAVTLWPITVAPEGHGGMEVRRDEIDELFAPRSQVQTHLRAVLTESRGKLVLLMAAQQLSLPQPVCGEQITLNSSTTNDHFSGGDMIKGSKMSSLSPQPNTS